MNINTSRFIAHVKSECEHYHVKCDLRNTTYVKISDSIKASGYFDESVPTLVCSMKRKDAVEILAHEYGHLTQWVDNIPLWKSVNYSMPELDAWLGGKEVPDIEEHIANCRDLELDNEKRSVDIIKKFDLPVDILSYRKKANSYVMFYNYMLISRRWCTPKNSPYSNKKIIAAMPDKFNMNYTKLPKRLEKIFIEEGF
jgi:hypothetical protein